MPMRPRTHARLTTHLTQSLRPSNHRICSCCFVLQAYVLDIADPSVLQTIEAALAGKDFQSIADYYLGP